MKPEQFQLMLTAARSLLAHRDAGRSCDPHSIEWAEAVLRQSTQTAPDYLPSSVEAES